MAYKTCKRCGEDYNDWRIGDVARDCPCKEFTVYDQDGETTSVFGYTAFGAVESYARVANEQCDNYLVDTTEDIIVVGPDGNINRVRVGAEIEVMYFAVDIEMDTAHSRVRDITK